MDKNKLQNGIIINEMDNNSLLPIVTDYSNDSDVTNNSSDIHDSNGSENESENEYDITHDKTISNELFNIL